MLLQQLSLVGELITSLGLGALVVIGYGLVLKRLQGGGAGQYVSAVLFALGAVAAMLNPIVLQSGYVFDARTVFIALAGPFGGVISGILAGLAAGLFRFWVGGEGTVAGICGIAIAMLAGIVFAKLGPRRQTFSSLLILGCGSAMMVFSLLLVELPTALTLIKHIALPLTLTNIAGVVLLGYVLENTRRASEYLRHVEFNAERDPLTKLFNRRALDVLSRRINCRQLPDAAHGSVILFDIDHFKQINDHYGHARGDIVLKKIAGTIFKRIRRSDVAVRYGGEEIAVVLLGTGVEDACRIAEQIRNFISELEFQHEDQCFGVTVSAGISWFDSEKMELLSALDYADRALYEAKNAGRNRVEIMLLPQPEDVAMKCHAS